jgi:hypothetical protein
MTAVGVAASRETHPCTQLSLSWIRLRFSPLLMLCRPLFVTSRRQQRIFIQRTRDASGIRKRVPKRRNKFLCAATAQGPVLDT